MNIREIRRLNARLLIETEHGGEVSRFADRIDKSQPHASSFTTENAKKGIGDQIASQIEAKHNKPSGWMDRPRYAEWAAVGLVDEVPEGELALPPITMRIARALAELEVAGKLTADAEARILASAEAVPERRKGSQLISRDVPEDLDLLQQILSGQEQIREEFTEVLKEIRAARPATVSDIGKAQQG